MSVRQKIARSLLVTGCVGFFASMIVMGGGAFLVATTGHDTSGGFPSDVALIALYGACAGLFFVLAGLTVGA